MIRLSDRVRLVRANNPSPMTLEGTNTYLVGGDDLLIIDPGPTDAAHLEAIQAEVGSSRVTAILLTHRHYDHAEAARAFANAFDAQVLGYGEPDSHIEVPVADGARVGGHGVFLTVMHTPGHAHDHVCYLLEEERVLFSGDHVLGRGTTIVAFPDGDMSAYMASLERVRVLEPARIYPGHGPVIDSPLSVIEEYIAHRLMRERQVLEALAQGPGTPMELVKRIYTDVDPALHSAAEFNVKAHLDKLQKEGRAIQADERWRQA